MIKINENSKLQYISSGLFKSDGIWCHPRRIIDTYEIIFMYEGTAYICEDGIEYTLHENDILLLAPGKEHYGFRPSDEYVSFSWIHYRTTHKDYTEFTKCFHAPNPYGLKTLFSQCLHTVNTPTYNATCADLYTALIVEEILSIIKTNLRPPNYLASQIWEYVRINIEKDLSVKMVAEHFGYHENHVSRIFKNTYGIQLKTYIAKQRIEYAHNLLHTTLYTVKQISQILSFKSENHFVKFFKYHTKITPSEYRNSYCNTHINKS